MQNRDIISPEIRALAPRDDSLGQRMLLQRFAGYSISQIAITFNVDEGMARDLIQAAIDDNILEELEQKARDHLLLKTLEIDNELVDLYSDTEKDSKRKYQAVGRNAANEPVVMNLEEDVNNRPILIKILNERRQLINTQKVLLGADTGERGSGQKGSDMKTILEAVKDVAERYTDRLVTVSRENGRLESENRRGGSIDTTATLLEEEEHSDDE